jgi:predicted DsbA family dithiol-disulfide isomerase
VKRLRLVVHSDYLCPWCFNASVRLQQIEREFPGAVEIEWRAFLLRPRPRRAEEDPVAGLERFVRYTQSWLRPAAEPDAGTFRVWETTAGPPSHSIPPQLVAKCAAGLGREAFLAIHERLLGAYFSENRDITDPEVLCEVWSEARLPAEAYAGTADPVHLERTLAEHQDALDRGMTGVPAAYLEGQDSFLMGAQPLELYRRWVTRNLPS